MKSISQILRLPAICLLCNEYHTLHQTICAECTQLIIPISSACRYCARPLVDDHFLVCGICIRKKPNIDRVFTAYQYEEPLRTLLHEFKYRKGLYLTRFLASLILQALTNTTIQTECLIPIPMHPKRIRQRGYNQAAELTKYLAKNLKIPYELAACKKIINTLPQAGLNAQERKRNIQNSFYASKLPFQHITLIDDLFTTGNTANELARVLKIQGIQTVNVWCCARAVQLPHK